MHHAHVTTTNSDDSGWRANLELGFSRKDVRTVLSHRAHYGPLRVQRPFYPEGEGVCHVYVLHPPGGVVGGDRLTLEIKADEGSHALLTTPGAAKFYRSNAVVAQQNQCIVVGKGAVVEWLPQDTIFFNGAEVNINTRINLAQNAQFIGWEIASFGRPGAGERFDKGHIRQDIEIWQEQKPLLIERIKIDGASSVLEASWGLGGNPVMGTFICVSDNKGLADLVRETIKDIQGDGMFSVTELDKVLVCRYLGRHAEEAKHYFSASWKGLRPEILGLVACPPRIWLT